MARVALRDDQTLFLLTFTKDFLSQPPTDEANEKAMLREIYKDMAWEADAILSRMDEVRDIYFDRVSQIRMPGLDQGSSCPIRRCRRLRIALGRRRQGLAMTEAYVLGR